MIDKIQRLNTESDFEYGLRLMEYLVENRPSDFEWQDIIDELKLDIHRDSLRKAFNTTQFSGYSVMKYYKEKMTENITDNEVLDEIEKKTIEMRKERIKLQDQRSQYQSFIRQEARWENLRDNIINEVKHINKLKPLLNDINLKESNSQKACLLLSDLHIGLEVDTYLNKYNIDIAKKRMKELELKTIEYCKLHKVDELNLEILGDLVSGLIHISTRIYNEENVIKQTMICAEILSEFITNLSKEINNINIYFSVGNHSRVVANYKEHLSEENFEYIVLWYLKSRLTQLSNVKFIENQYDDEICIINVFDKKIASVHGHKDKPERVLNELSSMLGIVLNEVHCGHYHNFSIKRNVLINGCLCGVDKHSQDLRYNDKPSQVLKVYYEDGNECIHKIILN